MQLVSELTTAFCSAKRYSKRNKNKILHSKKKRQKSRCTTPGLSNPSKKNPRAPAFCYTKKKNGKSQLRSSLEARDFSEFTWVKRSCDTMAHPPCQKLANHLWKMVLGRPFGVQKFVAQPNFGSASFFNLAPTYFISIRRLQSCHFLFGLLLKNKAFKHLGNSCIIFFLVGRWNFPFRSCDRSFGSAKMYQKPEAPLVFLCLWRKEGVWKGGNFHMVFLKNAWKL